VGVIPLIACQNLEQKTIERLPGFRKRMEWFLENRSDLAQHISYMESHETSHVHRLLAIPTRERLERVLRYLLDENEFLSPHGVRAVSRFHREHPYVLNVMGEDHRVDFEPAESSTGLFGGNSNWRGPVWFPLNYLLIESLQKFHFYLGDSYKVECPHGSGQMLSLWDVAGELSRRLNRIFLRDAEGRRPVFGEARKLQTDPHFRDYVLFYEYFHGDNGAGLGASHQTGWSGLVAKLIQQSGQ
jgi:hypothetical protein